MTVAPTQIHGYEGADRYELIDTPAGKLPRWHAIAHFIGETNALMRARDDALAEFAAIRNDAAVLQAQVKELTAQQHLLRELAVKAVDALLRADSLVKRVEAFEQRQRAFNEKPLVAPPGLDPNKEPEPEQELEGDSIAGTEPGEPSETHSKNNDELPVPPLEVEPIEPRSPIAAGFDKE